MRKEFVDFICELHGYLIRTKEIHWSTSSNSEHIKSDEFHEELMKLDDDFAEACMGVEKTRFELGKLLPLLPNSKNFKEMLSEFEGDVIKMKKSTTDVKYGGINSVLDDILQLINKYEYRITQE